MVYPYRYNAPPVILGHCRPRCTAAGSGRHARTLERTGARAGDTKAASWVPTVVAQRTGAHVMQ